MTNLTPKNIEGNIPNGSLIKKLDDLTFAEVTSADIEALGFVQGGNAGLVGNSGLGVLYNSIASSGTTFNISGPNRSFGRRGRRQRQETNTGEFNGYIWHDDVDGTIITSNSGGYTKKDFIGNTVTSITEAGEKGHLKGNNTNRRLFDPRGTKKIDLDTFTVAGSVGGDLLDFSPDNTLGASYVSLVGSDLTIRVFETETLNVVSNVVYALPSVTSFVLSGCNFSSDNSELWILFRALSSSNLRFYIAKVDIATGTALSTTQIYAPGNVSYSVGYNFVYDENTNLYYYLRGDPSSQMFLFSTDGTTHTQIGGNRNVSGAGQTQYLLKDAKGNLWGATEVFGINNGTAVIPHIPLLFEPQNPLYKSNGNFIINEPANVNSVRNIRGQATFIY